jgi:hypothetical protein
MLAVIYTGFFGDIERSLNNLKININCDYKIFYVTENYNVNKLTNKNLERINIKCYNREELQKFEHFGDSIEWYNNKKIINDFNIKKIIL